MSLNIVVEETARRLVANGSDGNICIRGVKTHLFVTLLFVVGAMLNYCTATVMVCPGSPKSVR